MTQRLVKIIYGYNLNTDRIDARHFYEGGDGDYSEIQSHTHQEWEDLLYGIRNCNQPVEIKKAVDEL